MELKSAYAIKGKWWEIVENSTIFLNITVHDHVRAELSDVESLSLLRLSQKFLQAGHSLYTSFNVNKRPYLKWA